MTPGRRWASRTSPATDRWPSPESLSIRGRRMCPHSPLCASYRQKASEGSPSCTARRQVSSMEPAVVSHDHSLLTWSSAGSTSAPRDRVRTAHCPGRHTLWPMTRGRRACRAPAHRDRPRATAVPGGRFAAHEPEGVARGLVNLIDDLVDGSLCELLGQGWGDAALRYRIRDCSADGCARHVDGGME